jgi:polar amino acid transport system substrate-binding protein
MRPVRTLAVSLLAVALVLSAAGCKKAAEPKLQPKVKPPVIAKAGVMRVGVDFSVPPFAGREGAKVAGLDIDVAAAIADKLGLRVEYVDVKPSDAATALADGSVDAVMSVPLSTADLSRVSAAGTYVTDAPAMFMAGAETTVTMDNLPTGMIAVQQGSESFWLLKTDADPGKLLPFDTLRSAFKAAESGEASAVAGDALVGAYIARDFAPIVFAGQIGKGTPLAVVVSAENSALADEVRNTLDTLAADGVLDSIRAKWAGSLPAITAAEEPDAQ